MTQGATERSAASTGAEHGQGMLSDFPYALVKMKEELQCNGVDVRQHYLKDDGKPTIKQN